jgi:hypothetical protein
MMAMIFLFIFALFGPVSTNSAQSVPVECPLPPYQLLLQAPARSEVDDSGALVVDGARVELPAGLTVRHHIWSDDGEVLLISATSPEFDSRVFAYRDGELTEVLGADHLLALREDGFRDAVTLFDPAFIPGTHTVLFNTEVLSDAEGIYVEVPLDLWSLDLDSGELTEILPYGEGGEVHIAPDGSTIVLLGIDFIRQIDLDGGNPRTLFEGTVALGVGHGLAYPDLVWDNEADIGDEVESRLIFDGPSQFLPLEWLSPDGYSAAQWAWQDASARQNPIFDVTVYRPDAEPLLVDSVQILSNGTSPFIRWDDPTHLTYGYIDSENTVTSWRADLCGEITELEPYQSTPVEVLSR